MVKDKINEIVIGPLGHIRGLEGQFGKQNVEKGGSRLETIGERSEKPEREGLGVGRRKLVQSPRRIITV